MKRYLFYFFAAFAALTFTACPGGKVHQGTGDGGDHPPKDSLLPLTSYLKQVESAKFADYAQQKDFQVADEENFDRMKRHILDHYQGVAIVNSFEMDPGIIVDCIKRETQPSLNTPEMRDHQLANPPSFSPEGRIEKLDSAQIGKPLGPQLSKNEFDKFKNVKFCDEGTIPLRRLLLSELVRFKTLDEYFHKFGVDGLKGMQGEEVPPGDGVSTHYWAHARQTVDNHGGDSRLNVWKPNSSPGVFALSQHWYVGGSGSSLQTCEGGWQVYPNKYSTSEPCLFIYRTNANYSDGSGCYNLDCSGFVQTNNSWVLGGKLGPVSTTGGTQYIIRMQWQLYEGNWWLFLQGSGDYIAVGYYPGSVYKGGQMSKYAQSIDYGGEVASKSTDTKTGQMGSGAFANQGWQKASYQRTIYYIDKSQVSHWGNLSAVQNTSSCYTADLHNLTSGSWATYLYFGGPKCPNP